MDAYAMHAAISTRQIKVYFVKSPPPPPTLKKPSPITAIDVRLCYINAL